MEKYNYVGKTREEALNKAMYELNSDENGLIITEKEQKGGLFKAKKVELEIIKKSDIIEFLKSFIKDLISSMGLDVNLEVKSRENNLSITIYSENNNLLIGKMGKNLDALTTVTKQAVQTEFGYNFKFVLDVGEYKEKQQRNIEYMAKRIAKEVTKTKIDAKLDPMNSYERRLVHSVLTNFKHIVTESEGEEPNRYVVVKYKNEEE